MKLPNRESALVDERKLRGYLLSGSHPIGRFKAKFFRRLGYGSEDWQALRRALQRVAVEGEGELVQEGPFGRKYRVLGTLAGPGGRTAEVATIWIMPVGADKPRLVTVYPR